VVPGYRGRSPRRAANGGLLHTSIRATGRMFGALFFSYVAESLMLFLVPGSRVRQGASSVLHLLALGARVGLEEAAWMISRAARLSTSTPEGA
jgi:hypothetical protein